MVLCSDVGHNKEDAVPPGHPRCINTGLQCDLAFDLWALIFKSHVTIYVVPAACRDFSLCTIREHDLILSDTKPIERAIVSQVYHLSPCRRRGMLEEQS